jgi:FkbM family methyltransferase
MLKDTVGKQLDILSRKRSRVKMYEVSIEKGIFSKIKRLFILNFKFAAYFYTKYVNNAFEKETKMFYERKLVLPLIDPNARFLFFFGTLSTDEYPLTKFLLKSLKDEDIFYDIGTNFGFYTFLAANSIETGEIHCFEPNRICVESLEKTKKINHTKNVTVNSFGISDSNSEKSFVGRDVSFYNGSAGNSFKSDAAPEKNFKEIATIKTKTLDSYVNNNKVPTLIKIDVEGSEYEVLQGAKDLLTNHSPIILMEVWSDLKGSKYSRMAVDILLSLNYCPYLIEGDGNLSSIDIKDLYSFDRQFANYAFKKITK